MTQNCSIKKCSKLFLFVIALFFSQALKASAGSQKLFVFYFKASTTKTGLRKVKIIKLAFPKNLLKKTTLASDIFEDNDLCRFDEKNIKQMAKIGSPLDINVVVKLDIKKSGKEKILHLNANDPDSQKRDSGDPETLISFCDWIIKNFPAKKHGLTNY